MSSSGGRRNYYNDDTTASDRSGVVMPDPRTFALAHGAAVDRSRARPQPLMRDPSVFGLRHAATAADGHRVIMPYRGNFGPGGVNVVDRSGVVTHDPGNFELGPATTHAVPGRGGDREENEDGESDGKESPGDGGDGEEKEDGTTETESFQNFPWYVTIWGWALLAIQGLVMGILYLNGGGREAFLEYEVDNSRHGNIIWDTAECSTGQGHPSLAEGVLLRAATATVAQLITFCAAPDLGLLKPFEAVWVVFGYVMYFIGLGMAYCCGIMATLPTYEVKTTTVYSNGNRSTSTHQETPGCFACLTIVFFWIALPANIIYNFTFRVAVFNLKAVCDLMLGGDEILWFSMSSLLFVVMGIVAISCFNISSKTGSLIPFARAFMVVDSLAIGATAVWGNYVQSGVVAGMFALLPLFNFFMTVVELSK